MFHDEKRSQFLRNLYQAESMLPLTMGSVPNDDKITLITVLDKTTYKKIHQNNMKSGLES